MAGPLADFIVSLNRNGQITSQGSVSDVLAQNTELAEELQREEDAIKREEHEKEPEDVPAEDGKLVLQEEIEEGRVSRAACKSLPP